MKTTASGAKKVMALNIRAQAHRHVRMFAAANDLTNDTVIEWMIGQMAELYPNYVVPEFAIAEVEDVEPEAEGV